MNSGWEETMLIAALAVLREFDVPMTSRVAAANFDVVTEEEASLLFSELEARGHVEQIEPGVYQLCRQRLACD